MRETQIVVASASLGSAVTLTNFNWALAVGPLLSIIGSLLGVWLKRHFDEERRRDKERIRELERQMRWGE
jgi:hypothetical protein